MRRRSRKSTPKAAEMDGAKLKNFVNKLWDESVVPSLTDYIRIPNKSPAFDKDWATNGHMDKAVALMEGCEESGSYDLPYYVDHLSTRIGKPGLVICLDSGCGDYDRLWLTTSLRGVATTTLTVRVLTEGVHSGDASGIVPSSFRIARQLLSRLENEATGEIISRGFYVEISPARLAHT